MGSNNIQAFNMKPMFIMVVLTMLFLGLASLANANHIAIVWGQGGKEEGTLTEACTKAPVNYNLVKISFLTNFGNKREPTLNLPGHCDQHTPGEECTTISTDIKACQAKGIKVLLSLGETPNDYEAFASVQDAQDFAKYLWEHFLAGPDHTGLLGKAILDGIDIEIDKGSNLYFGDFVKALVQYRTEKQLYLSATTHCGDPDNDFLIGAIEKGFMDYIFVKFYNEESCEYDADNGNATKLVAAWKEWVGVKAGEVYLVLPAATDAANSGFVPPEALIMEVLPKVKPWPRYGGVMLWNLYYDRKTKYSAAIVCCV